MLRDNTIYLINEYSLDLSYNHTLDFKNKQSQKNYFLSKVTYKVTDTMYNKRDNSFIVNMYINEKQMRLSNYCMLVNDDGKEEYYFIVKKEYKSDESTRIYIKLDVIQTYLFDIDFSSSVSYIERAHVQRYDKNGLVINDNLLEDEGLEVGEYEIYQTRDIYNYMTKGSYIVTSSTPLTTATGGSDDYGNISNPSSDKNWEKGLVSQEGFVLIKSMEGFASKPYNIGDGTNTIGYGTTSVYDGDHYSQLAPQCTETQASEVFADSLDNNYAKYVLKCIKNSGCDLSTVKQCHFDAFCSFYYNTGSLTSRDIWIMFVNGESDNSIAERWKSTVIMAGSQFEQGLRDRRNREANAFLGVYTPKTLYDISTGKTVTENNGKGYIPARYLPSQVESSSLRDNILKSAEKLLGKPYIYGGNYPPLGTNTGTDCSGLCQWSYNDNGIKITRTTYTQIKEGKQVSFSEARKGDLVFTRGYGDNGHVVMFIEKINDTQYKCIEAKGKDYGILYTTRTVDELHMFRNLIGD